MIDFDRLRKGEVLPSHFTRGLAMAGVDKFLTPAEIEIICQHYTVPKTASMDVVKYNDFLADVDVIFTKPVSNSRQRHYNETGGRLSNNVALTPDAVSSSCSPSSSAIEIPCIAPSNMQAAYDNMQTADTT